jgi:hypothetical protein
MTKKKRPKKKTRVQAPVRGDARLVALRDYAAMMVHEAAFNYAMMLCAEFGYDHVSAVNESVALLFTESAHAAIDGGENSKEEFVHAAGLAFDYAVEDIAARDAAEAAEQARGSSRGAGRPRTGLDS